LTYLAKM